MTRGHRLRGWLIAAPCLLLAGCGNPETAEQKTAPLSSADQIKQIQNDPKMTPEAKAAAIQSLQQGQARSSAMGQAMRSQQR